MHYRYAYNRICSFKIEVSLYALMWNNFQKIQTFNNAYFLGIALRIRKRNVNFDFKYIWYGMKSFYCHLFTIAITKIKIHIQYDSI